MLVVRQLALVFLFCTISSATTTTTANPVTVEGVTLPATQTFLDRTLYRQGYGIRRLQWAGMQLRLYVAGRWILEKDEFFTFTFLREFGEDRVQAAWRYQLQTSVSDDKTQYEGYAKDRDDFVRLFGSVRRLGTQQVILVGDETRVVEEGVEKGKILGKDFQRAFLSMWFGEKAVSEELKTGLLGTECLDREEAVVGAT